MKFFFKKIITYILLLESRLVIYKYKPKIVAITGSVGKTSTKDAVFAILSGVTYVRKSEKSYNSEIGLPLTILGIPNAWDNPLMWVRNIFKGFWLFLYPHKYPKWLVLEVGVGRPGDMARTAMWLKTDAVIITAIGVTPAHIEFFTSRKNLIEEKSGLIKTLRKGGFLILNEDDEDVMRMRNLAKDRRHVVTYGLKPGVDVLGSGVDILYRGNGIPEGIILRVDHDGKSVPVSILGVIGKNYAYATLAALAFSSVLKLNMLSSIDALKNYDLPPGRMRLLAGINGSIIIDDSYNSSPAAAASALEILRDVKTDGRKIAVLGDMLQLGKHTEEAHQNIGRIGAGISDILLVVGLRAKGIKEGALKEGLNSKNILEFVDSSSAGEFLKDFVQGGDVVLVKGSQGMRMERVVEAILLDKKDKNRLLVRQEKEWLDKK